VPDFNENAIRQTLSDTYQTTLGASSPKATLDPALQVVSNASEVNALFKRYDKIVLFTHGSCPPARGFEIQISYSGSLEKPDSAFGGNASKIFYATCFNAFSPGPVNANHNYAVSVHDLIVAAAAKTEQYLQNPSQ
jgi:hypothetical protein